MTSDEQFEAWFASKFPKINEKASDPTDPVRGQVKEVARFAWKYSRETLEIRLPYVSVIFEGYEQDNAMIEACRDAIHAAGVKTK